MGASNRVELMNSSSSRDGQSLLVQSRAVIGLKVLEYTGLVLFTVYVPRLMGPELYGQFSGVMATVALLTMTCGLGSRSVFGRFIPEYQELHDPDQTRTLFTYYFVMRAVLSVLLAFAMVVVLPRALPEAAGAPVWWGAGALVSACIAMTCYQLFYGLNALGRWLVRNALLKFVVVVFLVALGGATVLARAVAAVFAAEFLLLVVGLVWSRTYFTIRWTGARSFIQSHLRFGLMFFGANFLLLAIWRCGELMVLAFSNNRPEIGFFSLASAIAMALAALISQFAALLVPTIARLHVAGETQRTESWIAHSLRYLTISAFGLVLLVHGFADVVIEVALGPDYQPVAPNIRVLVLALIPLALIHTGMTLATVNKNPVPAVRVGLSGLVAFAFAAPLMVKSHGSMGASVAVVFALGVAGLVAYFQFSLPTVLTNARYFRVVCLGAALVAWMFMPHNQVLFTASWTIIVFLLLLFGTKSLTLNEVRKLVRTLRS